MSDLKIVSGVPGIPLWLSPDEIIADPLKVIMRILEAARPDGVVQFVHEGDDLLVYPYRVPA